MKKVLALVLSVLMIVACIPFAASATVAKDDNAIAYLLDDANFYHLSYLKEKDNFKTELNTLKYTGAYDDAWDNLFTGSVDADEAETILLALIEKVDANYDNEEFEEIIKVLETANTVAGVVEKVDSYTGLLDLAENSAWADSISALSTVVKAANYANDMYETFVEGYAIILSCQAASEYYGTFLDYIAENCANETVAEAAVTIKAKITKSLEDSVAELVEEIAAQAASDGAQMGVELAMDAWGVTATIKSVYNTVTNISKKVFNTTDKYKYMSSLVMVKDIEACLPGYADIALDTDDASGESFAINVLLTVRETGEGMLNTLNKVVEDTYVDVEYLFKGVDYTEVRQGAAKGVATLAVLRDVITSDTAYTTYAPIAVISTQNNVIVYNAAGEVVKSLAAKTLCDEKDANAAYVTVANTNLGTGATVTVVLPFQAGMTVETEATEEASSTTTTTTSSGNFFTRLIEAIKAAFAKLFGGLFG